MKQFNKKITEIIEGSECPLPLQVIPNYMGINLVSVESIGWSKFDDGQLDKLTIYFKAVVTSEKDIPGGTASSKELGIELGMSPKEAEIFEEKLEALVEEVPKTELEIIEEQINIASNCYKDNKTPTDDTLKNISQTLYDNLFGWRDSQPERPLQRPVAHSLVDIFRELQFGRPSEDQIFLQGCINTLES